jgi:hypothetical protein
VDCQNKCDTRTNRDSWNSIKIIQKIPEQHTGKARNQGFTENIHIGHSTRTLEGTVDLTLQIALYAP